MRNIFMLTTANFRKNKSQTVSLLLFVVIAALILNTGLVIYLGVGGFFDERSEQLNAPHYATLLPDIGDHEVINQRLIDYAG
jgi:putative ABC transport system permease protein